jgi:L-cysteate sulfo-lyase
MGHKIEHGYASIPKIDLINAPTPLQRATGLEEHFKQDGIEVGIYLKRDDLMPIGGGGNKLRKLQYHMAGIVGNGSDTVITFGGLQSNHARLTAAVCAKLGLECHLILTQEVDIQTVDYERNGNRLLNRIFGAKSHVIPKGNSAQAYAEALLDRLEFLGKKVIIIPTGGSTALGAVGYAECAQEILRQADAAGLDFKQVSLPNGSSATQAGLIAGWAAGFGDADVINGYAVMAPAAQTRTKTNELVMTTLDLIGFKHDSSSDANVDDSQLGQAYGQPTSAMLEAVALLARTEGVLLDPVYSGKAFAGMLHQIRRGEYARGDAVLFVMTGGGPGLYAYQHTLGDAWIDDNDKVAEYS